MTTKETAKQRLTKTRSKNADFLKRISSPPDISPLKAADTIIPLQLSWYSQNWSGRESKEVIIAYARDKGIDTTALEELSHKWFLTTYAGLIHMAQRDIVLGEANEAKIDEHLDAMLTLADEKYTLSMSEKIQREAKRVATQQAKYDEITTWLTCKLSQATRSTDEKFLSVMEQQLKQVRLTKDEVAALTEFLDTEFEKDYSDEMLTAIDVAKRAISRERKTRKSRK